MIAEAFYKEVENRFGNVDTETPISQFYQVFCNKLGIHYSKMFQGGRKQEYSNLRKAFCFYASQKYTLQAVADFMGYDNHTTVMHHRNSHTDLCETDKSYRGVYCDLPL